MWEKYVIYLGDVVLAVKFSRIKHLLIIGCYSRFSRMLRNVLADYFEVLTYSETYTQANKIRVSIFYTVKKFDDALDLMKEHGIVVEQVSSLQRIMR